MLFCYSIFAINILPDFATIHYFSLKNISYASCVVIIHSISTEINTMVAYNTTIIFYYTICAKTSQAIVTNRYAAKTYRVYRNRSSN